MLAAQQGHERRAADQPVNADPASAQAESAPARIYYFHTQANGLPEEMSDRNGNLVWRAQYRAWGGAEAEEWQAFDSVGRPVGVPVAESWARASQQTAAAAQNLRMQGQYLDRETGLHYNTFRYYDPDLGAFITPDPIGLAGGANMHSYALNPIAWTDPWGWCAESANRKGNGKFTEPQLPPKTIVKQDGVEVVHYTRSGDHGPAHAHVKGGGPETKVGQAGKPIDGAPPLTSAQQKVVSQNKAAIRKAIDQIQRWVRFNNM